MNRPMSTLAQAVRVRHPLKSVTPKVPTRQSSWISPSDLRGRSIGRLFVIIPRLSPARGLVPFVPSF